MATYIVTEQKECLAKLFIASGIPFNFTGREIEFSGDENLVMNIQIIDSRFLYVEFKEKNNE